HVRIALTTSIVAALIATATAQQPPPVFRAGTDLVEVEVVVHGRNGAFVSDLSQADFTIEEKGEAQEIQQFYLRLSDAAPDTAAPRPPAAGAPSEKGGRVFVVVFDDAHLTMGGFKRTQAAAQAFFSRYFRTGDIGGVVAQGRMAAGGLTTSREELLKAVKDAKPTSNKNSTTMLEQEWPRLSEIEAVRIAISGDEAVLQNAIRRACADDPTYCRMMDPEAQLRGKATQL